MTLTKGLIKYSKKKLSFVRINFQPPKSNRTIGNLAGMSKAISGFEFHEKLDKQSIEGLYHSDLSFALEMFQVYTEVVNSEFSKLETSVKERDFSQVKQDAHKMKPMFTMVGLPQMTKICKEIETNALSYDSAKVDELFAELKSMHDEHFHIIEKEITRIEEYINT